MKAKDTVLREIGAPILLAPIEETLAAYREELDAPFDRVNERIENGNNKHIKLTGSGEGNWFKPGASRNRRYAAATIYGWGHPVPPFQLHIHLRGISPPVWRRALIAAESTISELHDIIQMSMGWSDDHLHRFIIRGRNYGVPRPGGISFESCGHHLALSAFDFRVHERFVYKYDFHCTWFHDIRVEKILPAPAWQELPVCIADVGGCPPEDSEPADRFMEALDTHSGEDFVERAENLLEKPDLDRSEQCDGLNAWQPWIDRRFDRHAANARLRERQELQWCDCYRVPELVMRVRIQVVIEVGEAWIIITEIAQLEPTSLAGDTLGLHIAEAKSVLGRSQRSVEDAQVAEYVGARSQCPTCHTPLCCKGHQEIVYRTVFGKLTLRSPRLYG